MDDFVETERMLEQAGVLCENGLLKCPVCMSLRVSVLIADGEMTIDCPDCDDD